MFDQTGRRTKCGDPRRVLWWIIQFADWSVRCTPQRGALFVYLFFCDIQHPGGDDEIDEMAQKGRCGSTIHSLWLKVNDPPSPTTFFLRSLLFFMLLFMSACPLPRYVTILMYLLLCARPFPLRSLRVGTPSDRPHLPCHVPPFKNF